MAAVSNVLAFGLLYMRPLQWCLKTKGVSPRGNLLCMIKVTRRCLRALDMWRRPWFLSQGLVLGAPCRRVMLATDASLTGWGMVMSGHPARGSLRAGPSGEERGPPHSSVPVSPQCPREISLPTLPVFQGAAVSSEPTPQSSARKRSGAGELATPAGVSIAASSAVSCRSSVTGHRTSSSNNTRGQSRETGSLSRLFGSVETTAKCVCMGPAHCRARLSHPIRRAAAFQRGLSHCGEPRAGSGNGTGKNHLSRHCVGFDHDAGTFVTCSDRVNPHCSHESERRPVTHCKAVPATAGSDGSCVQRDPFGLLYMRPLQWWLRTKGFSPRGNPFRMIKVTRRCLRALDMWKKPWFLSQGPVLGAPCRRVTLATDASLTGWDAVMSGHPARGLWSGRHLTWHINCLEMLAVFRALKHFLPDLIGYHVLVRTDNTAVVYYINHQGGLRSRPLYKLAHQILVWSQGKLLSLRAVHVPGHLNMGADVLSRQGPRPGEWMLHPEVVKQIWRVFGQAQVDLFATQENAQCPHWFSLTHPAPLGLDAMVQTWPRLRLYASPPIALLPGVLERVRRDGVLRLLVAPYWPARAWFSDLVSLLDGSPWEIPVRRDLLSQAGGTILHPRPELWKLAPSTRKLYALKWKLFTSWCGDHQQDPVNCPVGTVLEFLQDRFSAGLAHSTLKVYVAAIAAYHALLGGSSVVIHTRQGFESLAAWAYRSPSVFGRSSSSRRGTSQKLPAARIARAFKLSGLYVTPPVTSRFSIGLFAHMFQSVVTLEAVSFPRGTMVTYVTWDGLNTGVDWQQRGVRIHAPGHTNS
ncbi:hypothetical protein M9458_055263 [Cirrhinus mrigala]|uniref:Reverse transcriptase RNase H-like domain-containing protein n=1 Tax=Cirrhinus mrigala TaxID=683832 RepID=A0ABD0MKI9_CIRMR